MSGKYLSLVFLICFMSPVFSLDISDLTIISEIWMSENKDMQISFKCSNCSLDTIIYVNIAGPENYEEIISSGFISEPEGNFTIYSITRTLGDNLKENILPYTLTVFCEDNNSQTEASSEFYVNKFTSDIEEITIPSENPYLTIYPLDTIDFKIRLDRIENGHSGTLTSGVNFVIALNDKELTILEKTPPKDTNSPWILKAQIPDDMEYVADKKFAVNAVYKTHQASAIYDENFNIESPLEVTIIEPLCNLNNPYKFIDTANINLTVKIDYKSKPLEDINSLEFKSTLDNLDLILKEANPLESKGIWKLTVNLQKQEPREELYNLDIFATYKNIEEKTAQPLPIQFVIPFKGKITNANNAPISSEIVLTGIDREEKIKTADNGEYNLQIIPGEYEIELKFDDLINFKFYDTELENSDIYSYTNQPIRYDSFEGAEVEALRIIAMVFAFQFDNAQIIIPCTDLEYDSGQIIIYQCSNWNFGKRVCDGGWNTISDIDKNDYRIIFEVPSFSKTAFAISEDKSFELEANTNKEEYFIEENIILQGKVSDDQGNGIKDAKVNYLIENTNIIGDSITDAEGKYTINLNAPKEEGNFNIKIKAGTLHKSTNTITKSLEIYRKKELEISVPNYLNMELGIPVSTKITIKNTGQTKLHDIHLEIDDSIPYSWYLLSQPTIYELDAGEQTEINLEFSVSEDKCTDCKTQYSVNIKAKSEATTSKSFILNIKGLESETKETEVEETNDTPENNSAGFDITGYFMTQSSLITQNLEFIIFLILLGVLARVIMLKKKTSPGEQNNNSMEIIKKIREEFMK